MKQNVGIKERKKKRLKETKEQREKRKRRGVNLTTKKGREKNC